MESTLEKAIGMFAFAVWDRRERALTLARDRLGEKPLYYGWQGNVFMFGSELKALRDHPGFSRDIDRAAVALYMKYGYIPAPASIYCRVFKLMPGTYLEIRSTTTPGSLPHPRPYWSLRETVEKGAADRFNGSDTDAVGELEAHLKRSISLQRIADVPLGAFLSGGVDSSTIVALMQAESSHPVKTYTVGYRESNHSEADYARAVARHLGTDHTELIVTAPETLDVIPRLPELYDEPFGDSSAIPTFLISAFARRHVKVALSGDGGDELFGGYSRYQRTNDLWRVLQHIPHRARITAARGLRAWTNLTDSTPDGGTAARMASYLSAGTLEACYDAQITRYPGVDDLVIGGSTAESGSLLPDAFRCGNCGFDAMMYVDSLRYLPDDILAKVDRASMGVSLEVRVPMLDQRLVEFAWRLPPTMKVRGREGKWLLKQLLRKYLPLSMIERPKMGFGIPVGQWLRGPLREWGEDLLGQERLRAQGFLNPDVIRHRWQRHLHTDGGETDSVWQVLAFQSWIANSQ
jgi:asparagine synthase (glutamine-hydrolysing)